MKRKTPTAVAFPIPSHLIRTKLDAPRLGEGLILRPHLIARLDQSLKKPLTLLHAPAGYGKSTLVAQWLAREETPPAAWLRLDEEDNDPERFVAYLVAAVQEIFPGNCQHTRSLLLLGLGVPRKLLTSTLLDELNALPGPLALVLDEYEVIHSQAIHQLVSQLLEYQPPDLHLILASRTIPSLSLARLRERRQVTEIGAEDLRLTAEEAEAILTGIPDKHFDETEVAALHTYTEGWVGGLHLAVAYGEDERYFSEFFLTEVLSRQAPDIQEILLETSVVERFSSALFARVSRTTKSVAAAEQMLHQLRSASLFLNNLDHVPGWYRYHRLFREALRRELIQRRGQSEITLLHRQAASWLQENGEIEAAIEHWLAAGERQAAADLVEQQVAHALASEALPALTCWLKRLPAKLIEKRPALLLAEAWAEQARVPLPNLEPRLNAVEDLLESNGDSPPSLTSSVAALYSNLWYWRGDPVRIQAAVRQARNGSPPSDSYTSAFALARSVLSQQMGGAEEEALQELTDTLQQPDLLPGARAQLLLAGALAHLSSGRLPEAEHSAETLQRLAEENDLRCSGSWARYLLGRIYYEWDRLEEAAIHYRAVVDDSENAEALPLHDSYLGLALIYETQGEPSLADKTIDALHECFWERGALFIPATRSFRARLAVLRGDVATAARQFAQFADSSRVQGLLLLEVPALTRIRILIARNSADSLKEAMEVLGSLRRIVQARRNRWRSVELLALHALILGAQGEMERALNILKQALTLAERGGMIRVFIDLGPPMAGLLYRLTKTDPAATYAGELLRAFPRSPQPVLLTPEEQAADVLDPLTDREWEVLQLMGQGLSHKEIAQDLFISPHTVKKHASNIYQKLDVSNRRKAIARARQLGILPSPNANSLFLALA